MFGWFKKKGNLKEVKSDTSVGAIEFPEKNEIEPIVKSFSKLLEDTKSETFYDSSMLEYGKKKTFFALVLAIADCKDTKKQELLKFKFKEFFRFRDGVGNDPVEYKWGSISDTEKKTTSEMSPKEQAGHLVSFLDTSSDRREWRDLQEKAIKDYEYSVKWLNKNVNKWIEESK